MSSTSLALGTAALAAVCCAGLPLMVAVAGGLTLTAILGLAGLVLALGLLALALGLRARRASCAPKPPPLVVKSPGVEE